ncbi:MAG: hypothetical protein ACK559_08665, partial [bacterium]
VEEHAEADVDPRVDRAREEGRARAEGRHRQDRRHRAVHHRVLPREAPVQVRVAGEQLHPVVFVVVEGLAEHHRQPPPQRAQREEVVEGVLLEPIFAEPLAEELLDVGLGGLDRVHLGDEGLREALAGQHGLEEHRVGPRHPRAVAGGGGGEGHHVRAELHLGHRLPGPVLLHDRDGLGFDGVVVDPAVLDGDVVVEPRDGAVVAPLQPEDDAD